MDNTIIVKFKVVGELRLNRDYYTNNGIQNTIDSFSTQLNEKLHTITDLWEDVHKVKTFVMVPDIPPVKKIPAYTVETKIGEEV